MILSFIASLFQGCKKPNTALGTEVQSETDDLNVLVSDTASIRMHTIKYTEIRSYQDNYKFLGSNQDPLLGRTDASIFTRFSMPNNVSNVSFGNDVVLDSAVMILTLTGRYTGDTTTRLNYQVYQLNSDLVPSNPYYNHNTIPYNPQPLCNKTQHVSLTNGLFNLRLPINSDFATAILTSPQYLIDNATFVNIYKGFYITSKSSNLNPVSSQGALMKIDLDNPLSGLYMYYHNGSSSASKESKVYQFMFKGDLASRFNNFNFNYLTGNSTNSVIAQLDGDSAKSVPEDVYLKGIGGTKAVIRLPYIMNYSDSSHISVNRAELVLKVDQSIVTKGGKYEPPLQLSLLAIGDDHRELYVKDQYYYSDLIRFGGDYDDVNKQYVFNVARHMQDVVDGKIKNNGFYLVVANPDKSYVVRRDEVSDRVVIGGPGSALYKPQFKLTYIRFPYDK